MGIITALQIEAQPLKRYPDFAVRVCGVAGPGIGDAVRELSDQGSRLIVSWGTAGALSPRLRAGDLILPERVVAANGDIITTDAGAREEFRRALDGTWPAACETLMESDRMLATPDDKRRLNRETDAAAVDMESARIGRACAAANLPFLAVRAIVDELDDRLPRQSVANISPHGHLRAGPLVASLMRYPGEWGPLVRLALRYRRARTGLHAAARVLAQLSGPRPEMHSGRL